MSPPCRHSSTESVVVAVSLGGGGGGGGLMPMSDRITDQGKVLVFREVFILEIREGLLFFVEDEKQEEEEEEDWVCGGCGCCSR